MRKMIQSTFAGLYNLDKVFTIMLILFTIMFFVYSLICFWQNSEGDRAIEMALRDPEKFVLKPQREGGG